MWSRSSWGVVFFGRPLLGLSLTSPVSKNWALSLEMAPGLTPNDAATLNAGTPASSCPIAQAQYCGGTNVSECQQNSITGHYGTFLAGTPHTFASLGRIPVLTLVSALEQETPYVML